jgi:hypothetical protein
MAKFQYTSYTFNKPPDLPEKEYKIMKELFNDNPKLNINPFSSFYKTFKVEIIVFGIGIICGLIASFDFANWLNLVFGIPAFIIAGTFIFSIIPSFFSYLGYLTDKSKFYSNLKRDIIKTNTFTDYINLREKRRWSQF